MERVQRVDATRAIEFDWGSIQWLCAQRLQPDAEMTFGYVEINAGVKNPRHVHPNCDEVLYLIEGVLEHRLDREVFRLESGAAIHIPKGVEHDARNVGPGTARMVVAYSAGDRQTVFLESGRE